MKLLDKIILSGKITSATVVLAVILVFVYALPIMWLWNWLMPAIFGIAKINFFQSAGLYFLSGLLFRYSGKK